MRTPEKYLKLTFSSPIADCIEKFIAQQRIVGYIYNTQANDLKQFDRFIATQDCPLNRSPRRL